MNYSCFGERGLESPKALVLLHLNGFQIARQIADPQLLILGVGLIQLAENRPPNGHLRRTMRWYLRAEPEHRRDVIVRKLSVVVLT